MRTVELIYDADCPHAEATRDHLRRALEAGDLPSRWREWNRADPKSPPYAQSYGSPTVLVDGRDVDGQQPMDGASACRVYKDATGRPTGVLPVGLLTAALGVSRRFWRRLLPTLPGMGVVLLPVGLCPACWPAYAGVLATLGVPFLIETRYLLPLVVLFLALAVAALGYRARTRRGNGPLALGLLGSATILVGKFALSWNPAAYVGLPLLLFASLWNAWPKRRAELPSCPACAHEGAGPHKP